MDSAVDEVRVRLAPDGFYPCTFRWAGRDVRVLSVEGLRTCGPERRFRVRTIEGVYELTHDTDSSVWRMRRSPTLFSRALALLALEPRYTLPIGERRLRSGGRASGRSRAIVGGR
ncbi:MAG: hypothetical protein ACM30E_12355 [Nitrososphaerales archaeon]